MTAAKTQRTHKKPIPVARKEMMKPGFKEALYIAYDGRCALCGYREYGDNEEISLEYPQAYGNEIHHIYPVSEGGWSTPDNLILLCPNCHKAAHHGSITEKTLHNHCIDDWDVYFTIEYAKTFGYIRRRKAYER